MSNKDLATPSGQSTLVCDQAAARCAPSGSEQAQGGRAHHSPERKAAGDRVYTPDWVARDLVAHFDPAGVILEPCRGAGAIFRHLPPSALWCEIEEGSDFFQFAEPVDWIITNPPYSQTRAFMRHSFTIAREVVLLVPARNVVSGYGTVREGAVFGGMREIRWYGTGGKLGFPMGNAIAAFHWSRGYKGLTRQTFHEDDAQPSSGKSS